MYHSNIIESWVESTCKRDKLKELQSEIVTMVLII